MGTAPTALPLAQVAIALIAVLAAILVLAWAARRVQQRSGVRGGALLRTHASLSVGPRERAVLVEAGGQFLLLGVANGQVRLLHCFDTPPELPHGPAGTPSGHDFLTQLREVLRNRK
ncbi:MAG TPA: flagellar biosynthetic protein FliO [Nevskiaceae bacterium]|nr:flagellar biosynthetic protein FliO [Nevskiaceae bacterium]